MKTAKDYGLKVKQRPPVKPLQINLGSDEGKRVVLSTARQVAARHKKVIVALADR